jgi:cellulose synthase/poly-beta-1,6-N-acetylglucosamine synthase-like glycosyltransferase
MQVWILACCAILTLYHHVGYPALLRFLAKSTGCRGLPAQADVVAINDFKPSIEMLIPAHDEERVIGRKIINCAEIDYPEGKFSLIIVLDGCNDNTAAVLESTLAEYALPNLRTAVIHPNIGKIGVLNRFIPEIQADLVALSDTSAL